MSKNPDLFSDPARWRGMDFDVEDKVADILIADGIMHE